MTQTGLAEQDLEVGPREAASRWDELWQRSAVANPLSRAALIAQWVAHFSPRSALQALEVHQDGRLVAALPLLGRRRAKLFEIGGLPSNAWALCGDLLLDPAVEPAAVDRLAEMIAGLPWPLIQLSPVAIGAPHWQAFGAACRRRELEVVETAGALVGQVEIGGDWLAYRARWSKNHRRQIDKAARRARLAGRLALEVHTEIPADNLQRLLKLGFEVEDRSWKGRAGTSVLRTAGMFDFFLRQAEQLAHGRRLQLTFLKHDDRAIAFEYGYLAKGVYFSHKVGYDPAYSDYSPGQLLRAMLLERLHQRAEASVVDFCGPITEATAKWSTRGYRTGKWLIAPRRILSRCALLGYGALRRARRLLTSGGSSADRFQQMVVDLNGNALLD